MPSAPDLSALYQKHSDTLKGAYRQSGTAFDIFAERDAQVGALAHAYQDEMVKVFTIAKAVQNPTMAIASVPLVLAAANMAFAKAPVTEQSVTSLIEDAFKPFQ